MKALLSLIVLSMFALNANAMNSDSLFCFTKKEITILANRYRETEDSVVYLKALMIKKDSLIILQDSLYLKASNQINLYNENMLLWRKKESEYKNIIKNTQPKWYDSKLLWFGIGVVTTLLIGK